MKSVSRVVAASVMLAGWLGLTALVAQQATTPPPVQNGPQASGTLPTGTAIHIQLNTALSTDTSRQGDAFTATVSQPVLAPDGHSVLVPATSIITGNVATVQKSGKMSGDSELQLNFQTLRLPNGSRYPMRAQVSQVDEKGGVGKVVSGTPSTTAEGGVQKSTSRSTVGNTAAGGVVGTAIGAIAGGGKGAAIGALSGAGLGAIFSGVKGGKLDLPVGTGMTITLNAPVEVHP